MGTKLLLLILLSVFSLSALNGQHQNRKQVISGYVVDRHQYPVANAAILVDGLETGYVTDTKGYYRLRIRPDARLISVSVPVPGTIDQYIDGRRRINFAYDVRVPLQMENVYDAGQEEINVGYGTESKRNLTMPVNKIDATQNRFASYETIFDLIRGEVPGVRVDGKRVRIQCASSFLMGTEPLYVVDGVTARSIDLIAPQMVKSIEVLKGASASIYGSQGGNGVILITTRR